MARDKKAWKEAKRTVDRVVELVRRLDSSPCERKLSKSEYAMMIGVLMSAGPVAEAACGNQKRIIG